MEDDWSKIFYQKYDESIMIERERLSKDAFPDSVNNEMKMGANFIAKCNNNAEEVRKRVIETLLIINKNYENYPISLDNWMVLLPEKFVKSCSPELTEHEIETQKKWWFKLSYRKKLKEARRPTAWELSSWLYWFEEKERMWFWWGSALLNDDYFIVSVEVLDDPFMSGALKWLLKGCGADEVMDEEDFFEKYGIKFPD